MTDPRTRKLRRQSLIGVGGLMMLGLLMVVLSGAQAWSGRSGSSAPP